jgi:hypothetical protein
VIFSSMIKQVAAGIWAGVHALLSAFAAGGDIDPNKEMRSLECCQSLYGLGKCKKVEPKK